MPVQLCDLGPKDVASRSNARVWLLMSFPYCVHACVIPQPPLPGIDREEDDMDIGDDMDISHEQPPASTEAHALQGYTAADVHTHAQAYAQQQGGGAAGLQSGPGQAALELASSGVAASRTAGEPGIGEAEGVPKVKRKEYAAGAVRSATPPVLQQPAVEAVAGEGAGLAGQGPAGGVAGGGAVGAGGVGLEKKRRAEKAAGSSSGAASLGCGRKHMTSASVDARHVPLVWQENLENAASAAAQ
eukprot:163354-Pelagomonas_calceolata.AAC.1